MHLVIYTHIHIQCIYLYMVCVCIYIYIYVHIAELIICFHSWIVDTRRVWANAGRPWPTLAGADPTWTPLGTLTSELLLQRTEKAPNRGPERTKNGHKREPKTPLGVHWDRKEQFHEKCNTSLAKTLFLAPEGYPDWTVLGPLWEGRVQKTSITVWHGFWRTLSLLFHTFGVKTASKTTP